ncbi:MAG: homoserine kinase [Paenibacillaceae bacterium]
MSKQKVRVRIPASTANLGPGFDTLGMALELYAWIDMEIAEATVIHLHGDQMRSIPTDKKNLVYRVAQQVFAAAGVDYPELEISMYSDIPLTRGLGSSASAIIGGMYAANALAGNKLTNDELFQLATRIEDHPDNVGASLYGGIVVAFWDGQRAESIRIEPNDQLEVLVAIPDFYLATEKARNVLPKQVSMKDAVFNVGHSSLLVAAMCTGNLPAIRLAMKDALHQPYRSALIPSMELILRDADQHGALGVALSGAGPTLLALVDSNESKKTDLEAFLLNTLRSQNVNAKLLWLKPSSKGVELLHIDRTFTSLFEKSKGEVRA